MDSMKHSTRSITSVFRVSDFSGCFLAQVPDVSINKSLNDTVDERLAWDWDDWPNAVQFSDLKTAIAAAERMTQLEPGCVEPGFPLCVYRGSKTDCGRTLCYVPAASAA